MTYKAEYERLMAQTYDEVYAVIRDPSGDVGFYKSMACEFGGPLLELGCGTGRTLLKAAETGIECVGLDSSREMLDVLVQKTPPDNLTLVHDSIETFDLGKSRFQLITAPFRTVQHLLDPQSQLAALQNIRRHLAPSGAFIFDVFDPNLARMAVTEEPEQLDANFQYRGQEMRRYVSVLRDISTQIMTVSFRFEGGNPDLVGSTDVLMRWFYRYELEHLLSLAGFPNLTFYRDFAHSPWSSGGEIIVVARL